MVHWPAAAVGAVGATRTVVVSAAAARSVAAAVAAVAAAARTPTRTQCSGVRRIDVSGFRNQVGGNVDGLVILTPVISSPPTVTPNVVPAAPDGNDGWYRSDVEVSWTINDNGSPITGTSGCDPTTIDTDTTGITLTCSATNAGGTGSGSVTIKRDATAPTITAAATTADGRPYTVGSVTDQPVTVTFTCADVLSGVATCPGPQVYADDGVYTASGAATDIAGNTASTEFGPIRIATTTDLAVTLSGPSTAPMGGAVTYTLQVTNQGQLTATNVDSAVGVTGLSNVTITPTTGSVFTVPGASVANAVWRTASLAPGATAIFSLHGIVDVARGNNVNVSGAAMANTPPDPNHNNNAAVLVTRST